MKIEKISLENFKVFRKITLKNIPKFCVIVGANGTGKSTLFDVFGFIKDCLIFNVTKALQSRGGFNEVVSRGYENENIKIEIKYRAKILDDERLITYYIEIGNNNNKPAVVREILKYKRGSSGQPFQFLNFAYGKGFAIKNEEDFYERHETPVREEQDLGATDILAIKGLGQFQKFKAANTLRQMIESWHVSDFHIDAARGAKEFTREDDHLSVSGDNLQQVTHKLFENHRDIFDRILEAMQRHVPGVDNITTEKTVDGRLVLQFGSGKFKDPFIDRFVSDGTLKMFAYLVLLNDPRPHPFLCVEEPENQLYPRLLVELAEEFRTYSSNGGQVMVSTHSPDFLDGTKVDEVFWIEKGPDGFSKLYRAEDDPQIKCYMENIDKEKMGNLWRIGLFGKVDPK